MNLVTEISAKFVIGIFVFSGLCPQLSVPQVCQRLHLCMAVFHFLPASHNSNKLTCIAPPTGHITKQSVSWCP